jgi:hypothetical protein
MKLSDWVFIGTTTIVGCFVLWMGFPLIDPANSEAIRFLGLLTGSLGGLILIIPLLCIGPVPNKKEG